MSEPDLLDDFYADLENVNNDTTNNNNKNSNNTLSPTSTIITTTSTSSSTTTLDDNNNKNVENKFKRKLDEIDNNSSNKDNNSPTKKINTSTSTSTSTANKALIPPSLMKKKQSKTSPVVKTSKAVTYSAPAPSIKTTTTATTPIVSALPTDILYRQQQQRTSNYLNIAALKPQVTMEESKTSTTLTMGAAGETWVDPTLSEWDQNDFRIFVGDLGNDVTDDMLKQAFIKYPTFLKAKVIRDAKSGKSKGFGFVSLSGSNDFLNAMRDMNGKYVGNRPIKLRKSKWKDRLVQ